jgi:hypothetical protein
MLRFLSSVTSKQATRGHLVDLEVAEDVFKDGNAIIPKGTVARGQIIRCETKDFAGTPGILSIGNFYILSEKNVKITLDGILTIEGKDSRSGSRAIGSCCFFGYLMRGGSAVVKKDQTVRAVVRKDCVI